MFRISRRADYAVRVMIAASRASAREYMPSPRIGDEMQIPHPFMVKVVGDLRRSGLIATVAGRSGGIRLARPAGEITLRQIVEAVEGPLALTNCLVEAGPCQAGDYCPAHAIWDNVQRSLFDAMEAVNLSEIEAHGYLPGNPSGQ